MSQALMGTISVYLVGLIEDLVDAKEHPDKIGDILLIFLVTSYLLVAIAFYVASRPYIGFKKAANRIQEKLEIIEEIRSTMALKLKEWLYKLIKSDLDLNDRLSFLDFSPRQKQTE